MLVFLTDELKTQLLHRLTLAYIRRNDADLFAALRDFDTAYSAYADFQRQMEAYWSSLVYLQQQGIKELTATLLKDDLVRIDGLSMVARQRHSV